ncbi:MAG: MarR family transcriptional regulator/GNAT family N-acetyltransferase [Caulobacteraceae bacterium]|nr:MarR family transcriptional regulator/GNAT family N-acetyltransferase [Caulobacteraceae bacterium]
MTDVVRERSALFLGSRMKRLAERMQGEVIRFVEAAGLPLQPSHMPILATLDEDGPQTIGRLTESLQLAQPTVTRALARLVELGIVEVSRIHRDQRQKTVALTSAGQSVLARAKMLVWARTEAAVEELIADLDGPLLRLLDILEDRLAEESLDRRGRRHAEAGLTIREYSDDLADAFKTINAEWISDMYAMEQADLDVLDHPREAIIDGGGDILFVEAPGVGVIGTCALRKTGEGAYELTKMGVLEAARGAKAGEFLLRAVIERAQTMGATCLYLLSNQRSAAAIHLYEKLGFVHDEGIMQTYGERYERCNVAMLYRPEAVAKAA